MQRHMYPPRDNNKPLSSIGWCVVRHHTKNAACYRTMFTPENDAYIDDRSAYRTMFQNGKQIRYARYCSTTQPHTSFANILNFAINFRRFLFFIRMVHTKRASIVVSVGGWLCIFCVVSRFWMLERWRICRWVVLLFFFFLSQSFGFVWIAYRHWEWQWCAHSASNKQIGPTAANHKHGQRNELCGPRGTQRYNIHTT